MKRAGSTQYSYRYWYGICNGTFSAGTKTNLSIYLSMRRRINILQANLLSVQHYKLQFITTTSSSTCPPQSTSSNDTQRTQWTEVSESSTTPSFSSEGYQFSLSPNTTTTTTTTSNNNTLYHSSVPTSNSSNTHLYISLYQCPTRDGEYTLTGSTFVPVDVTPSTLPVSLFKTKHHTHPSELFVSLRTIVQDATVDAAFDDATVQRILRRRDEV